MNPEIPELFNNDAMCRVYLRHAYQYAAAYSKDPSTQLGAILVKSNCGVVGWSVNGFPRGISEKGGRWVSPKKYHYVEHAERNVIYKCAERGISTNGLIMYCPWIACADCARAIIQSGISAVIGHKEFNEVSNKKWNESVDIGMSMLKEAGVATRLWSGKIGNKVEIVVNGNKFRP